MERFCCLYDAPRRPGATLGLRQDEPWYGANVLSPGARRENCSRSRRALRSDMDSGQCSAAQWGCRDCVPNLHSFRSRSARHRVCAHGAAAGRADACSRLGPIGAGRPSNPATQHRAHPRRRGLAECVCASAGKTGVASAAIPWCAVRWRGRDHDAADRVAATDGAAVVRKGKEFFFEKKKYFLLNRLLRAAAPAWDGAAAAAVPGQNQAPQAAIIGTTVPQPRAFRAVRGRRATCLAIRAEKSAGRLCSLLQGGLPSSPRARRAHAYRSSFRSGARPGTAYCP